MNICSARGKKMKLQGAIKVYWQLLEEISINSALVLSCRSDVIISNLWQCKFYSRSHQFTFILSHPQRPTIIVLSVSIIHFSLRKTVTKKHKNNVFMREHCVCVSLLQARAARRTKQLHFLSLHTGTSPLSIQVQWTEYEGVTSRVG